MEREELHRRVALLKAKLKEGKLHIASHLAHDFEKSILKVCLAPDGLVDPETVDGRIRSLLTSIAYQADRDEWKEVVSLRSIQEAFFQRVEYAFNQPYQMMIEANSNPYQFSGWFASDPARVKESIQVIDDFVSSVLEFWENISEPTWIHLEDSFQTKAVFTGELFPDSSSNIASSTGIYFDTTVLPDPFVKLSPLLEHLDGKERCNEVLRLALQVLQYRELALADIATPIVAILPDRHKFEDSYREFVHSCAEKDTREHAGTLFGREFTETEELLDFLREFKEPDTLVAALARPSELVFATEWKGDLSSHIRRYLKEHSSKLNIRGVGDAVFMHMISRFSQANDSFQRSRDLRGTPVVRAETSWLWFNWMLRGNSKALESEALEGLHISRALGTTVKTEMSWLGNIPPAALIKIRQEGALDEIRDILGSGLKEIIAARPENFFRTGDKVFDNLRNAFLIHESKLKELRTKKWTFAGRGIGSFLVVGGIEMTAAITGIPLFGAIAATASMTGVTPTAKDLRKKLGKLREKQYELDSTGIGILFKHKQ